MENLEVQSIEVSKTPSVGRAIRNEGTICEIQNNGSKLYLTEAEYFQRRGEQK